MSHVPHLEAHGDGWYVLAVSLNEGQLDSYTVDDWIEGLEDGEMVHQVGQRAAVANGSITTPLSRSEIPELGQEVKWRAEISDDKGTIAQCPASGDYAVLR